MSWLYVPTVEICVTSASVPEAEASISASSWQCRMLERSCWWRGKPRPSQLWSRQWKRNAWLRRLCGAMYDPSRLDTSVAAWMASSAASPASRIRSPASGVGATTPATCGARRGASSCSPAPGGSSSKTSPACSPAAAPSASGVTWADLVSSVKSDFSRRRKSARAMSAQGSSSSAWPTSTTSMTTGVGSSGREGGDNLQTAVSKWPTARVSASRGAGNPVRAADPSNCRLEDTVAAWPTPTTRDHRSGLCSAETATRNARPLSEFVGTIWSTPRASDGEKGGPGQSFGAGGVPLAVQTAAWATPTVKGNHNRAGISPKAGDGLATQAARLFETTSASPPPAPETPMDGSPCSTVDPISPRRLNPLFVEWLMGWPEGWTSLALARSTRCASIDCGCSETAFIRWRRHMRFALSHLASPPAIRPQTSLFGP